MQLKFNLSQVATRITIKQKQITLQIRQKMLSMNGNLCDKIQGWDSQEDDHDPSSNNMLRILESKIINSVRLRQQYLLKDYGSMKFNSMRPATVRVRPTESNNNNVEIFQSHPTIDICNFQKQGEIRQKSSRAKDSQGPLQLKYRNKSMGNNVKRTKDRNKQNMDDKQFHLIVQKEKQKSKGEELQMKKQSLIFRNYNSLKEKKTINRFHQMEIKMRKNRQINNRTALSQKEKVNIVVQSFRKGNQIVLGCNREIAADHNGIQIGLEKPNENNYVKLSRKQKLLFKQKDGKRKETDVFTDAHLTELSKN